MNKILIFLLSMLPLNIKKSGIIKFSFGSLALQSMTVILVCGIYVKWFVLKNIESADILGIAGLVFGTGYLTNQHKKMESEKEAAETPVAPAAKESDKPEPEDKA